MDKYNPDAICPKCASDDISSRFIRMGSLDAYGEPGTFTRVPFMGRHCRNCHYEWREEPLDEEAPDALL